MSNGYIDRSKRRNPEGLDRTREVLFIINRTRGETFESRIFLESDPRVHPNSKVWCSRYTIRAFWWIVGTRGEKCMRFTPMI